MQVIFLILYLPGSSFFNVKKIFFGIGPWPDSTIMLNLAGQFASHHATEEKTG